MKKSEIDKILGRDSGGSSGTSTPTDGALPRIGATVLEVLVGAPTGLVFDKVRWVGNYAISAHPPP